MKNIPVRGEFTVTAAYGETNPKLWGTKKHAGVDIAAGDRRVFSVCAGRVRVVAFDPNGWGQYVTVGDGEGRIHLYAHLVRGSVLVSPGEAVTPSVQLGTMGATGNVTGVHLHYQINDVSGTPQDPTPFLGIPNARGVYRPDGGGAHESGGENGGTGASGGAEAPQAHWAERYYDSLVARGAIDGGATSEVWRRFDASAAELTVGQLLALADKLK